MYKLIESYIRGSKRELPIVVKQFENDIKFCDKVRAADYT